MPVGVSSYQPCEPDLHRSGKRPLRKLVGLSISRQMPVGTTSHPCKRLGTNLLAHGSGTECQRDYISNGPKVVRVPSRPRDADGCSDIPGGESHRGVPGAVTSSEAGVRRPQPGINTSGMSVSRPTCRCISPGILKGMLTIVPGRTRSHARGHLLPLVPAVDFPRSCPRKPRAR
jgi:hypothetical protein